MNELESYISSFWGITGANLTKVATFFKTEELKKGEFYLTAGKTCASLSFLRSGLVRFYFIDDNGEEITQWIGNKGSFVTDLSGLIFKRPSRSYIQALSDCECYTLRQSDYELLGKDIPEWHHLEKLFIAHCFLFMEERTLSLLSMNAEERYKWLFNYNPSLLNEVPLHYLASMMGMSPETLSRIRRKISS